MLRALCVLLGSKAYETSAFLPVLSGSCNVKFFFGGGPHPEVLRDYSWKYWDNLRNGIPSQKLGLLYGDAGI